MTERPALEPYIGQTIPISAKVTSRAQATGRAYGFLLEAVTGPDGEYLTDHGWLKSHSLDLAAVSGHIIRANGSIAEYAKAGRTDGVYHEYAETGTGISRIRGVEVEMDGEWIPLADAAKLNRKRHAAAVKASKADGGYIWPGTWAYRKGLLHVKAAKSAVPGSRCAVVSRGGMHNKIVRLTGQVIPGIWTFAE
jgi:hypothetical protein